MPSLLKQLEDSESLLLMYLADELPAGDRAEVDRRLAGEPGLRQLLEEVRNAQSAVVEMMRSSDSSMPLPVSSGVAVRHVSRAIRQWQIDRLSPKETETAPARGLRYPWWVYPSASAAALFLAFLVWWGNWGHDRNAAVTVARDGYSYPETADPYAAELAAQFEQSMSGSEEYVEELKAIGSAADELAAMSNASDPFGDMYESFSEDRVW